MPRSRILALAGMVLLLLSPALHAQTYCDVQPFKPRFTADAKGQIISDAAALSAALQNARGGETYLLTPGNYGTLKLGKVFSSPVVIRSVDPRKPACFNRMEIEETSNLHLDGIYFDYSFKRGEPEHIAYFAIQNSSKVRISNSVFGGDQARDTGTLADGDATGLGLLVLYTTDVDIENTEFRNWWKGIMTINSKDIRVIDSHIHSIRSDGLVFDNVDDIWVARNYIHDFGNKSGSQDHRDMIQIQRANKSGSNNITIRDNVFDMGSGGFTQTIWAGGDGQDLGNRQMRHQNILIENNIIYNGHIHGISIHGSDNISVRKNTLIHVPGGHSVPTINISSDSTSVVIEQNATAPIIGYEGQRDWVILNNAIIQDQSPSQGGYYDNEFIYYAIGQQNGYNEYGVRQGGVVDQLQAGSTLAETYPSRR